MKSLQRQPPTRDLILVDTMNLLSISFYSKQTLSYEGVKTGMLYGVIQQILRLRKEFGKAEIRFLWEGFNSIRKSKHPFYKSQRHKKDDDFILSIRDVETVLPWLNVYQYRHSGLEADDLAGYFVTNEKDKHHILLLSTDRDWWGFANPSILIRSRNENYTYDDLKALLGYLPEKLPLFKVLKGDISDNVGGIPRFPTSLAIDIVKHSNSINEFHKYFTKARLSTQPHLSKWKKALEDQWNIVTRNADLILFHPEWIDTKALQLIKPSKDNPALKKFLASRGMLATLHQLQLD